MKKTNSFYSLFILLSLIGSVYGHSHGKKGDCKPCHADYFSRDLAQRPLVTKGGEIELGTTLAQSGEAALIGTALSDGLSLYLNKINTERGGLKGTYKIELDQRDDKGLLTKGGENINALVEKTPFFFSPMGDEILEKELQPLIDQEKAVALFPIAGISDTHSRFCKKVIFFRPSYNRELRALVDYAVTVLKKQKIAVFYEESNWGTDGLKVVEKELKKHDLTLVGSASYQANTVNIMPALNALKKLYPTVIICIANGRPAYNFIRQGVNNKLHYVNYLGISRLAAIQHHLDASRGVSFITSSVVPNPVNSQLDIVKEYRADMGKYLPNKGLSPFSLEGYINSALLVKFLDKLSYPARIIDLYSYIGRIARMNFKGLNLSFQERTLSQTVWINTGTNKKWPVYTKQDLDNKGARNE